MASVTTGTTTVWFQGRAYTLPASPNVGDEVTIGNRVWTWDGDKWVVTPAPGTAAGSDTEIQWNDNGGFGASDAFTWDDTNNLLSVAGDINIVDPGGTDGYAFRINGTPLDISGIYSWQGNVNANNNSITNLTNINGTPVANFLLSTGSYADPTWLTSLAWSKITGAPTTFVTSSDTAPATPNEGDLWFDTDSLSLFIFYSGAWVGI